MLEHRVHQQCWESQRHSLYRVVCVCVWQFEGLEITMSVSKQTLYHKCDIRRNSMTTFNNSLPCPLLWLMTWSSLPVISEVLAVHSGIWMPVLVSSLMQQSALQVPVISVNSAVQWIIPVCGYSYLYSWVRLCHIFSSHFSILFGWNPESQSLPGSHFQRQHICLSTCPPQICIWRSGDKVVLAQLHVPLVLLWDWCFHRPVLLSSTRVLGYTAQLSLQEVTRLRRTHPWIVFPGCVEDAAGVWALSSHSECELESWYRWAPCSLATVPLLLPLSAASWLKSTSSLLTNIIFLNKLN